MNQQIASCRHRPACPGCPRFGASDASPDSVAELRQLCERHGARFLIQIGARRNFRCRARLSVRGRRGAAKIGIFAEGSHRVVDIPQCEIHHPLINEIARALKAAMRRLGVSCYDDNHHVGLVRGIQVVVERSSNTAQVVVICNDLSPLGATALLTALQTDLGERLHSLWWNGNAEVTNRVLGSSFVRLSGPECVVEESGGARVFYPPGAFGQNNLDLFDPIIAAIHTEIPEERDIVELFAGTGSIGLGLARRARSILFNELSPDSLRGLELGIASLGEAGARARVVAGPAELAAQSIDGQSIVIADPPRKGLGSELLRELGARRPERLYYVSCGIQSFARDTQTLFEQGLLLQSATAYDVFPYTEHIETLGVFARHPPR